jgi:hypothetical protein
MARDDTVHGTDELVRRLAREAGDAQRPGLTFAPALTLGTLLALAAAALVVAVGFGLRPDLAALPGHGIFQFKVAAMGLLAAAALWLLRAAGTPGARRPWGRRGGAPRAAPRPWPLLVPALILLLVGAWLDRSGFPLSGARTLSVPVCLGAIIAAALPGLVVLLAALRRGIPTRLSAAGALAGLTSGALGALAYTLACINDGAAFVALWYPLAIAVTTALGAILGPRVLAW